MSDAEVRETSDLIGQLITSVNKARFDRGECDEHGRDLCPTGCGRVVAGLGMLMCAGCWREVPRHLQRGVYRTWGAYRRVLRDDDRSTVRSAREAWRAAADAAIASIA